MSRRYSVSFFTSFWIAMVFALGVAIPAGAETAEEDAALEYASAQVGLTTAGMQATADAPMPNEDEVIGVDDEPDSRVGSGIEEITVKARKRDERLQDVPISVSAFSGAQLDQTQTFNTSDIQFQVPNMLFGKTNFTGANLQIRGIGSAVVAASGESAVGTHVNTVPVSTSRLFEAEFYDVQRIEVLRGPQGTLFGRNSTGGSYNVYTNTPTSEWESDLEVMFGNYDNVRLRGAINMPFHDKVRFRLAGTYLNRSGFIDNLGTGNDIDDRNLYALRGSFTFDIADATTLDVMGSWFSESDSRSRIGKQLCNRDENFSPFSLGCEGGVQGFQTFPSYSTLGGILESYALAANVGPAFALYPFVAVDPTWGFPQPVDNTAGSLNPPNLRVQNARIDPIYNADEGFAMFDLKHELRDMTLSLVAGYQYTNVNSQQDYNMVQPSVPYDPTAVANLTGTFSTLSGCTSSSGNAGLILGRFGCIDRSFAQDESVVVSHGTSVEARAVSDWESAINFTAGAIFSYVHAETDYYVYFSGAEVLGRITSFGNPAYDPTLYNYNNETKPAQTYSFGLFGEAYWDITDMTKLTAGARYIYDKKTADSRQYLLDATLPPFDHQEADWNNGTFRVTLDQKLELGFADESMVYGSVSRGFKPGGFNPPAATGVGSPVPETFDPEIVWAFEAGTKNEFWDNRVRANLTGFFYLYKGYQISSIVNRTAVNENIDANVWGLEFEYIVMPIDNFQITGSVAYLGTSIQDSAVIDTADPTAGVPGYESLKNLANGSNYICDSNATPCDPNQPVAAIEAANGLVLTPRGITTVGPAGVAKILNGNELPNVPDVQIFIQGQYTFTLPWEDRLIPRISYYWQNEMYGRMFNDVRDEIPSWSEASAGLRYETENGHLWVDIWVKNFTDTDDITGQYFTDASSGNFTNVFLLDPRTYGITVGGAF